MSIYVGLLILILVSLGLIFLLKPLVEFLADLSYKSWKNKSVEESAKSWEKWLKK